MDEKAKAILAAIKKDDLAAFRKLCDKETEKYAFGRFPLLSLCYLFDSRKIAFAYEKKLLQLSRYTQIEEDRESYLKFRVKARRVLRLYVGGRTISPLVMLAVTGRHDALRALYPAAYKDAAIRSEIEYAEAILYGSDTTYGRNSIRISREKMQRWQAVTTTAAAAVAVVMLVCCLLGYFFVPQDKGTASAPVRISNGKQIAFIMDREGYFELTSDVTAGSLETEAFKGTLEGNGKTIKLSKQEATSIFGELTGTIKNTVIEVDVGKREIKEDEAFFIDNNKGVLENVTFVVKGSVLIKDKAKQTENEDTTVYVSAVCGENNGTIKNCKVVCNVTLENEATRNSYFAVLVSKNNGKVTECDTSGSISADTVDISGMVTDNTEKGTVSDCESAVSLAQTTTKSGWSPNIGGICLMNEGTISSCSFSGSILGVNTQESDGNTGVFLGGICVTNDNLISESSFVGTMTGTTDSAALYMGGVTSFNYKETLNCLYKGTMEGTMGTSYAAIGGIAAMNAYKASGNTLVSVGATKENVSEGKIILHSEVAEEESTSERHIGGVVGLCNGASLEGDESSAEITCEVPTAFVGGCVGVNLDKENVSYVGAKVGAYSVRSTAKITVGEGVSVGGIAGYSATYLKNSESDATLVAGQNSVVGGIAARNHQYIENATSKGTIVCGDDSSIGGVAAINRGLIKDCTTQGSATLGKNCLFGGVAGNSTSSISGCQADVTLVSDENTTAGGIVGFSSYYVASSTVTCNMTVGEGSVLGGIAGYNLYATSSLFGDSYTITESSVEGTLKAGKKSTVGGIAAINGIYIETTGDETKERVYSNSSVDRCKTDLTVVAGEESIVGGAVGRNSGKVYEVYVSGSLQGAGEVGGLIGKNEKGDVKYGFSALSITASGDVGSLFGWADKTSVENTLTYKDRFIEQNKTELEKRDNADDIVEEYYKNNSDFYVNSYVEQEGIDAYGVIEEYDKSVSPEAYALEAVRYETEEEMKKSDKYKEIFNNETEQNDDNISGNDGGGSAL